MNSVKTIVASLENAPQILLPLITEIPSEFLKRRPAPKKWSAHEHAVHLAEVHTLFFARLELMLSEENPKIKSYLPDRDDEDGVLLEIDLKQSLAKFTRERGELVEKLNFLSHADWQRTALHEEYAYYSVFVMFRHLALHDYLHAYRIEEILLKRDWE